MNPRSLGPTPYALSLLPLLPPTHVSCPTPQAATLATGAVSARHSTPGARPCPRWALEQDGVRAVWAECRDETKLVTVIDTVTDHPCGTC
jgi:hypothetical protein